MTSPQQANEVTISQASLGNMEVTFIKTLSKVKSGHGVQYLDLEAHGEQKYITFLGYEKTVERWRCNS